MMSEAFALSLDSSVQSRLEQIAAERQTTREELVRQAVATFLDECDAGDDLGFDQWQIDKIRAGMAAADRGEFATDEEVERVFAKYRS